MRRRTTWFWPSRVAHLGAGFHGLLDRTEARFGTWRTEATEAAEAGKFGRLFAVSVAASEFFSTDGILADEHGTDGPDEWNLLYNIIMRINRYIGRVMDEAGRN